MYFSFVLLVSSLYFILSVWFLCSYHFLSSHVIHADSDVCSLRAGFSLCHVHFFVCSVKFLVSVMCSIYRG